MNFYITVNNREIEAVKGETILQALRRAGISIPTLCNMEGFTPTGACRLCMVEVKGKTDLIPACSNPVEEWMDVQTHTTRVIKARRVIVELLLSSHPDDCLYCERNCHCELQDLAFELNIRERKQTARKSNKIKDLSSPAIIRDPAKCILCGRCVRVCEEVMGCSTLEFSGKGDHSGISTTCDQGINSSSCITCGQCILVCPTSALYEKKNLAELQAGLNNPALYPVAIIDPVVSVTLASLSGSRNLRQTKRQLNGVLKKCGFREVYDLASIQDLYIRRIAEEVIAANGSTLFSSHCPAWIKYAEQYLQDLLPSVCVTKSPSQLGGALIKHLYSGKQNPKNSMTPFTVNISPCTARKFEARRKEFNPVSASEVDLVITARALEQFIRLNGLTLNQAEAEDFNKPFQTSSMHGELGGISGGTMEAVASAVHAILSQGQDLPDEKIKKIRSGKPVKEIEFIAQGKTWRFAAVSSMAEASRFISDTQKKPGHFQFIEILACPGGCVNGGGEPITPDPNRWRNRQKQILELAEKNALTSSLRNRTIDELISDLGKSADTSEPLFKTSYYTRKVL